MFLGWALRIQVEKVKLSQMSTAWPQGGPDEGVCFTFQKQAWRQTGILTSISELLQDWDAQGVIPLLGWKRCVVRDLYPAMGVCAVLLQPFTHKVTGICVHLV